MYTFSLTEEIARWAFEVNFDATTPWKIAFTNPTAGPWKTIKAHDPESGAVGEVYRFELEETRPDIILYNDTLKLVLIIEAKDSLEKLIVDGQPQKSVEVVANLSTILKNLSSNKFWGKRSEYKIATGILWGAEREYTATQYKALFSKYYTQMKMCNNLLHDYIIGIETKRHFDSLSCSAIPYASDSHAKETIELIVQSMGISLGTIH